MENIVPGSLKQLIEDRKHCDIVLGCHVCNESVKKNKKKLTCDNRTSKCRKKEAQKSAEPLTA